MIVKTALDNFKGDKRTKEYRDIVDSMLFPLEDYNRIKEFRGKVTWEDIVWLFNLYNTTFNKREEPCKCGGVIRRMIIRLIKTWERTPIKTDKDE